MSSFSIATSTVSHLLLVILMNGTLLYGFVFMSVFACTSHWMILSCLGFRYYDLSVLMNQSSNFYEQLLSSICLLPSVKLLLAISTAWLLFSKINNFITLTFKIFSIFDMYSLKYLHYFSTWILFFFSCLCFISVYVIFKTLIAGLMLPFIDELLLEFLNQSVSLRDYLYFV